MTLLQMETQWAVLDDRRRNPNERFMTNPYTPVIAGSRRLPKRNLAMVASIVLASITVVAFCLDAFAVVTYAMQSGDTSTLRHLWVGALLVIASLLLVYSEIRVNKRTAKTAVLVLIPLFLYSVYSAIQTANSYNQLLTILKAQPTVAIGMLFYPMIWLYAGLFAIRAVRSGMSSNGR